MQRLQKEKDKRFVLMGKIKQMHLDKAMPQFDWKGITDLFWLGGDRCTWKSADNRRVLVGIAEQV